MKHTLPLISLRFLLYQHSGRMQKHRHHLRSRVFCWSKLRSHAHPSRLVRARQHRPSKA